MDFKAFRRKNALHDSQVTEKQIKSTASSWLLTESEEITLIEVVTVRFGTADVTGRNILLPLGSASGHTRTAAAGDTRSRDVSSALLVRRAVIFVSLAATTALGFLVVVVVDGDHRWILINATVHYLRPPTANVRIVCSFRFIWKRKTN